ncbi:low molecular weight phosphotyrosine protein phosphatase [bacterium]|nr:low molecular weight phosphotyrosine protein phosphatase [bacterium]
MTIQLCFVCLGNICRSPTAEGVMLHLIEQRGLSHCIKVDSAGTGGYHLGEPADPRSVQAARRRGVHLPSRARQFEKSDFKRFDYILAMDSSNLQALERLAAGQHLGKIHLLRDFDAQSARGSSVPDPYYGGDRGFEEVLDQCFEACQGLLQHLIQQHQL